MKPSRPAAQVLHALGVLADTLVLVAVVALGALGAYCLWDTQNVVARADSANYAVYRPDDTPSTPSYADLVKINPETVGWLTLYGTKVDYPLVQGSDNEKYLSCDATGEFSMSGALYLDCRAAADFSGFATVVYGHHMDANAMFGSLDRFLEPSFFDGHVHGDLYFGGAHHGLTVLAAVPIEDVYRTPLLEQPLGSADAGPYLADVRAEAACLRDLPVGPSDRLLMMSTCHSDSTNGRLAVVARIDERTYPDPFCEEGPAGTGLGNAAVDWVGVLRAWWWVLLLAVACGAAALWLLRRSRRRTAGPRGGRPQTLSHPSERSGDHGASPQ